MMKSLTLIQNELKAPKSKFNSFGKYKYRTCEDILEAVKPLLEKYKSLLFISDEIKQIGDRFYVQATANFTDTDGQQILTTAYAREALDKKGMDDSQITGAASSYARKYALNGLFLIDDTQDADSTNKHEDTPEKSEEQQLTEDMINKLEACKTVEELTKVCGEIKKSHPKLTKILLIAYNERKAKLEQEAKANENN